MHGQIQGGKMVRSTGIWFRQRDIKIWLVCMAIFVGLIISVVGLTGGDQVGVIRPQFSPVSGSYTSPAEIFIWSGG